MNRVAVKESVLRWAMDRSNTSAESLRTRFPKINEWLTGDTQPTLNQLEELATATTTPLGMLFLDSPPEERLPIPLYRTMSDKKVDRPSPDLLETIQTMQRRQDWMREYLIEIGQSPLPIVGSAKPSDSAPVVAEKMREALGFDTAWASREESWEDALRVLRDAMDRIGVLVIATSVVGMNTHRLLDPDEFRGFVLSDEYAPLVFINTADPKVAQMFTLAHEQAHVFLGTSAAFDLEKMQPAANAIERACNKIAAEFLVPELEVRRAWSDETGQPWDKFDRLAKRFKVSSIVIGRRALDVGLVSSDVFGHFYATRMAKVKSVSVAKGGNVYAQLPQKIGPSFGAAVVRSVREGRITYSEAYSLTGLRGNTFEAYAGTIET